MAVSKKHADFVKGMRDKPATALPGVGPVTGERLKRKGIFTADHLLDKFIKMEKNRKFSFEAWLEKTTGANSRQADDCARALEKWSRKCNTRRNPAAATKSAVVSRFKESRDVRMSHTRRTVTVTEEKYQYSRSYRQQHQVNYESSYSESEDDEYYYD